MNIPNARLSLFVSIVAAYLFPSLCHGDGGVARAATGNDEPFVMEKATAQFELIDEQHSHYVDVNGVRMHYLEWGDGTGIPLVWLHGYGSTAYELAEFAPALVSMGFQVYAVTYRGHGQTQVSDHAFSVYTVADDVKSMFEALDISCAIVGGWSLGGHISAAFYASYPELTTALVLVDGGAMWPQLMTEKYAALRTAQAPAVVEEAKSTPESFQRRSVGAEWVLQTYMSDYVRPLDTRLASYAYSYLRQDEDGGWILHYDHQAMMGPWADLDDLSGASRLKLLPRSHRSILPEVIFRNLNVPLVLIDPTGDDRLTFSRSDEYLRLAAQHPEWIRYVEYPDTPHAAHLNRPDWFLRDMESLKGRLDDRGGANCPED